MRGHNRPQTHPKVIKNVDLDENLRKNTDFSADYRNFAR
jgi:hypothetical protein